MQHVSFLPGPSLVSSHQFPSEAFLPEADGLGSGIFKRMPFFSSLHQTPSSGDMNDILFFSFFSLLCFASPAWGRVPSSVSACEKNTQSSWGDTCEELFTGSTNRETLRVFYHFARRFTVLQPVPSTTHSPHQPQGTPS